MKALTPIVLVLAVACNSTDGTALKGNPSDISSMNVGDVRVLNPSDIPNGINLPAVPDARDFVIIVGNTNPTIDAVANFVVKANRSAGGSFGLSATADLNAGLNRATQTINATTPPQQALESRVRSYERANLTLRSGSLPFGATRLSLSRSVQTAIPPAIGDTLNVNVPDGGSTNLCNTFFKTRAVVASVSRRAILAVDTLDGSPTLLFPQTVLDSITQEFDNNTFVTDSSYFGNPTDIDGNGRIILLFTGRVNNLTPAGSMGGFVGGFFFAGDYFPPTGLPNQSCAESNRAEIMYLLAPDPTGKFGNVRSASSVRQGTRGTIPHELEHMINAGNRYVNNANAFEDNWLDESLAHIAEEAVGRVSRGFTDLQLLTMQDMLPAGNQVARDDFNAFFFQNFARLSYWMARPDTSSGISSNSDANLSSSGADWAIGRFAADNYSNGDVRGFTRKLTAGPSTGINNFTTVAGAPLDTLMAGWLVSMYADHLGVTGLNPAKYQYRSYNFRNIMPPVAGSVLNNGGAYPLQVTPVGSGSNNISTMVKSGSGVYFRLTVAANAGAKNVKVLDPSGSAVSFTGAHVYVLRIQ
jgi:hypothetical protein